MLQGSAPSFVPGGGPADGRFSDDTDDLARWVTELRSSVLAVQGPPGTGKTYRGAHMAKELVAAGKRVGIMAMSHNAIDNFLAEIVDVFAQAPALDLRASRNQSEPEGGGLAGVSYVSSNSKLADPNFDVVCGTAWTFASRDLLDEPVDVVDLCQLERASYALQVKGDSMIEDGIFDGDYVLVEKRNDARNGETVVAILENNEATLKRFYRQKNRFKLEPANAALEPIYTDKVEIRGVVVGVVRGC